MHAMWSKALICLMDLNPIWGLELRKPLNLPGLTEHTLSYFWPIALEEAIIMREALSYIKEESDWRISFGDSFRKMHYSNNKILGFVR